MEQALHSTQAAIAWIACSRWYYTVLHWYCILFQQAVTFRILRYGFIHFNVTTNHANACAFNSWIFVLFSFLFNSITSCFLSGVFLQTGGCLWSTRFYEPYVGAVAVARVSWTAGGGGAITVALFHILSAFWWFMDLGVNHIFLIWGCPLADTHSTLDGKCFVPCLLIVLLCDLLVLGRLDCLAMSFVAWMYVSYNSFDSLQQVPSFSTTKVKRLPEQLPQVMCVISTVVYLVWDVLWAFWKCVSCSSL